MISVLLVNHNGAALLPRCLESLGPLGGSDLEAVLVDNASSDGSLALLAERFPEVKVEASRENLGFAAALNRAAELARGDRLLLLNTDAWLAPGALRRLATRLDTAPRLGAVAPRLAYPDGRPQIAWAPDPSLVGEAVQQLRNRFEDRPWVEGWGASLLRLLLGPGWLTAACLLVRRAAFASVAGFDPEYFLYFEDVDFCLRLRRAGWRLGVEPGALCYHAKGGSGAPALTGHYRESQLRYYAKHRPRWEGVVLRSYLRRRGRLPGEGGSRPAA
ncbi:MAG TPA: glycosyltransferase family 2 protein [Thermoanaerobaculia bacterium]|nr:glycosyltransferase family 2 protein [Thermoanaerobaculia bacterium]